MTEAVDRRFGLILFGALQAVLGVICAALVFFFVAGAELAERNAPARAGVTSSIVVLGLAAVYLVSVGIGSIRARRWARSLSIVVSAIWLAGGAVATLMVLVVVPRLLRGMPRPTLPLGCSAGVVTLGGVVLPLLLFLFYRLPAVQRTCEARDPNPRWTERVPLPVLAMVVIMSVAAIVLLANVGNPMMTAFGKTWTGAATALAFFAVSVLCAVIAVQLYRLKESGWWMLLLLQIGGLAWGISTIVRSNDRETAGSDPFFVGAMLTTWLAHFAFLLYLRRFFVLRVSPRTRSDD